MKKITLYIFILLSPFGLMAQNVSINQGGAVPDNSAMLDVSSTSSGLLIPRMTLVQRNVLVSPANSLLIYQTDNTPGYYFNSGTATIPVWDQLITSGDNLGNHVATTNIELTGNYLSGDGDNEGVFVTSTGYVGIGVTNPSSPFNVKRIVIPNASDGAFIDVQNGSGTTSALSGIRFKNNTIDGNVRYNAAIFHRLNTPTDYQLNFGVRLNALNNIDTSDIKMTINSNGNVGIGTTVPDNRLTVSQNSASPFMSLESGGSNTLMDFVNTGTNPADWTFGYLGNTGVNPGFMTFLRAGVHRMTITNNGDVGIGTNTPGTKLTVDGGVDASLAGGGYIMTNIATATNIVMDDNEIMARNNGVASALYMQNDGGDFFVHGLAGTQFTVLANGSVGIGTNAPASWLHLNHPSGVGSGFTIQNSIDADQWEMYLFSTNTLRLYFNGIQRGSFSDVNGVYTSTSDIRLKNNITDYTSVINDVMSLKLKSYYFNWQDPSKSEKSVGFIAQELLNVFPHLVHGGMETTSEGEDYYSVDYSGFGPIAIKAIQEQQELIERMNERIEKLEVLLNELKSDE